MWFDPGALGHSPQAPLATLATLATLRLCDQKTGNQGSKVAEVAEVTTPHYRWLIHFADRNPLEVCFSPEASHAEVLAIYPDTLAAEPIEPGRRQADTLLAADQEAAVLAWLAQIGETDRAIVAEVLALCRRDDDARKYFLERAAKELPDDDRRRCSQCGNQRSGVCVVACPGGLVSANRGYRPASPGVLQRCAGYVPNANDTDQRPGRERWPGLAKEGND